MWNTLFRTSAQNIRSLGVFASSRLALSATKVATSGINGSRITASIHNKHNSAAGYATSSKSNEDEFIQSRLMEINSRIQSNPRVFEAYGSLQKLIADKGVLSLGAKPSYFQLMKIMSDSEIQMAVQKVAKEMKAANIELSREDIEPLIELLSKKN